MVCQALLIKRIRVEINEVFAWQEVNENGINGIFVKEDCFIWN